MGPAALALVAVGTLMQVGGGLSAADAMKAQGTQQRVEKNFEAQQMRENAGQEVAASQRQAIDVNHQYKLIASRALALGGASGAGMSDPTMAGILTDIGAEGSYKAATAIYEGASKARKLEIGAEGAEIEGEVAEKAGYAKAKAMQTQVIGSVLQSAGSMGMYAKYGMGNPTPTGGGTASLFSGTKLFGYGEPLASPTA